MTVGIRTWFWRKLPGGETAVGKFSPEFLWLGRIFFDFFIENLVPVSVVILIIVAVLCWVLLELTPHGRLMYAIGSN